MPTPPKTIAEIVDETVDFYRHNPRSIFTDWEGDAVCLYRGSDNLRCAVARCCQPTAELTEQQDACYNIEKNGDAMFLPAYQGHPPEFWQALQELHDTKRFWQKVDNQWELTRWGQDWADEIKSRFA